LHAVAHPDFAGISDTPSVNKRSKARSGIGQQAATISLAKFRMPPRNHGPLRLIKNYMTSERIAADSNNLCRKRTFGIRLAGAFFEENDLHRFCFPSSGW
jgi:hypothetical protein